MVLAKPVSLLRYWYRVSMLDSVGSLVASSKAAMAGSRTRQGSQSGPADFMMAGISIPVRKTDYSVQKNT
jgi:hypothetical protein